MEPNAPSPMGQVGLEPTTPVATVLQTASLTNLDTDPGYFLNGAALYAAPSHEKRGSADGDRTRKFRCERPVTLPICLQHQEKSVRRSLHRGRPVDGPRRD
jgi:hypothetical protein